MKSPTAAWLIVLAIYCASLFFAGLHGGGTSLDGWVLLMFGWVQAFDGRCFAWLANPAFGVALLLFISKRYRAAGILALVALAIGLDTFRVERFAYNEAGHTAEVDSVGLAFYLWEASFLMLAAFALGPRQPMVGKIP
ncbi:hypothetical protein [Pseudomonas sp. CGJS7]|uniref:hypothetical protein n=1 Tax=Pseudomonas sp. CGJS7 TaxID=3109348 RepID=UPI00300B6E32